MLEGQLPNDVSKYLGFSLYFVLAFLLDGRLVKFPESQSSEIEDSERYRMWGQLSLLNVLSVPLVRKAETFPEAFTKYSLPSLHHS